MSLEKPDTAFWKRKLAGMLHDPPSKALDVATHGERSRSAYARAGFTEAELNHYHKESDWTAAAADRIPFPRSRSSGLRCQFDGRDNAFRHPLDGTRQLRFPQRFTVEDAEAVEADLQSAFEPIDDSAFATPMERMRAVYFAHWRLWSKHCAEPTNRLKGYAAWLPADTRLPDHSIWSHMALVSALAGCADKQGAFAPAFLKLQIGPVQDFIAAARSTLDLWSGSYLLSWLMAVGLKKLSELAGPDAVIFPSLLNQPLFDLQWKAEIWDKLACKNSGTAWEASLNDADFAEEIAIPNLPNVLFAVVPAQRCNTIGKAVEAAIREEWERIADCVWDTLERKLQRAGNGVHAALESEMPFAQRAERFEGQVRRFLSVDWHCLPWPEDAAALRGLAAHLPAPENAAEDVVKNYDAIHRFFTVDMPLKDRDERFYTDKERKDTLNNIGNGWAVLFALNSWGLDAVRSNRKFEAWAVGGWDVGTFNNKDVLNGREEAVVGGRLWSEQISSIAELAPYFKHKDDWIGASTLVKRLWPSYYLKQKYPEARVPRMPNTVQIAKLQPEADGLGADEKVEDDSADYFAVLAFDGDQIGKWVSGTAAAFPKWRSQLADYTAAGQPGGALRYFAELENAETLLAMPRPVSPSYHLQFSQALSNFANRLVRRVVRHHKGRLIYAGGDDVLAMLPATTAVACAADLRKVFRGESLEAAGIHRPPHADSGFLQIVEDGKPLSPVLLVPGPALEASVGIAFAHAKHPLQDVVRSAQAAEKRAKRDRDAGGEGRAAISLHLLKRSGEQIQWGGRWDAMAIEAMAELREALKAEALSNGFPQKWAQFIAVYLPDHAAADTGGAGATHDDPHLQLEALLLRDFAHAVKQSKTGKARAYPAIEAYLRGLARDFPPTAAFRRVQGLCAATAFIHRKANSKAKGAQS